MGKHALFNPSGMKRKRLCPASHKVEMGYPDRPSGPKSILGTHVHTVIETAIERDLESAYELEGETLEDHEGEFVVTAEMVKAANQTLHYLDKRLNELPEVADFGCEMKVNPGALIDNEHWYGTLDLGIWYVNPDITKPSFLEVIDHKNGSYPVSPEENDQLISYALGLIEKLGQPMSADSTVRLTISQPNAGGIKSWDTTISDLFNIYLTKLEDVIEACNADQPTFIPGDEQCQFCNHKRECAARNAKVLEAANQALGGVSAPAPVPDQVIPANSILPTQLPAIESIDADTRAQLLMAAPMLRGWLKDLEEDSIDQVQKGMHIPGFKLIAKKGRRAWIDDPELVIRRLCNLSHEGQRLFKKADVTEERPISFTTVLADSRLTEKQKALINKNLIRQGKGGVSLVPDSHKGEDISPSSKLAGVNVSLQSPTQE